ncbi:tRNA pseudouridine(55) synthase TruB [Oceanicaulis sp. MMSF_3324]|uniref:tRNA pseudouridine(55) synthase TruB n=1 Tax=Oceanicaulis sp. MMSF_3324 TaxID=3046702 RepID=UPI00273D9827|nr:tRNA pseudouridine(55) synthase TruB [Oceanicaulis sp. MMSF_3324]
MGRRKKGEKIHGWLILDKPLEMTSTQAVSKTRWLLNAQKAGHAGTLDPLASGVLPIAFGEATKTVPFAQESSKAYKFTLRWGRSTTTLDAEGEVTGESDVRPSRDAIEEALGQFIGEIEQVPPKFSAIKVDGERAYDLARAGEAVELDSRPVRIDDLRLLDAPSPDLAVLEMKCGKGAYVRSIARDLAAALGAEGHVAALRRTKVGPFSAAQAVSLDVFEDLVHKGQALEALLPVETALDDIPATAVTEDEAFQLRQGRSIVLPPRRASELRNLRQPREIAGKDYSKAVVAMGSDRAIAIGEARAGKFSPVRVFQWD